MAPGMWSLTPGRGDTADRWRPGAGRRGRTTPRSGERGLQAPRDIILLSQVKLRAALPGAVDMMGFQQPVSQLQATKAFAAYLNEQKGYKKPVFIKHIIKSNDRHK